MAALSEETLAEIQAELAGPGLRPAKTTGRRPSIKALADMKAGRPFQPKQAVKSEPNAFDALCREVGVAVRGDYFTQEEYEDAR